MLSDHYEYLTIYSMGRHWKEEKFGEFWIVGDRTIGGNSWHFDDIAMNCCLFCSSCSCLYIDECMGGN